MHNGSYPENILSCKELLSMVTELRHLNGLKGGIAFNESEYMATTVLQRAKPLTEIIYSNVNEVVAQGLYTFESLWKNAIPAIQRIREIETGIEPILPKLFKTMRKLRTRYFK